MFAGGSLLDVFFRVGHPDDALHENAGRVDLVRIDLAGVEQMFDLGNRDLRCSRHHRVEIARGLAIGRDYLLVALERVHERDVGGQSAFHDVVLAVEFARFLALGDDRADAGLGEKGRDTRAAGADALGQSTLRG